LLTEELTALAGLLEALDEHAAAGHVSMAIDILVGRSSGRGTCQTAR
jgi:hypothetical protein